VASRQCFSSQSRGQPRSLPFGPHCFGPYARLCATEPPGQGPERPRNTANSARSFRFGRGPASTGDTPTPPATAVSHLRENVDGADQDYGRNGPESWPEPSTFCILRPTVGWAATAPKCLDRKGLQTVRRARQVFGKRIALGGDRSAMDAAQWVAGCNRRTPGMSRRKWQMHSSASRARHENKTRE
jgi:hypothetical protein